MTDLQAAETMAPLLDAITSVPAVIPRAELIFVPGGAAKVLDSIKERARKEAATLDVSRPRDRDAMRSLAYKLRRLKTTGDDSGKDLKADLMAKVNPIDAERRVWRSEMDELIAEIIAPAEAFDAAEETRIREHEAAVADLVWPKFTDSMEPTSAEATALIDALDHMHVARQWQEFSDRAAHTRANSRNALLVARMNAETREKAEAEAARIAEEAAEAERQEAIRLQAEREAEIARQAAEAARVAAEVAAREEAAKVAAEAERARIQAERAAQAEIDRLAAEQRAATEAAEAERMRIILAAEEAEARAAAALVAEQERAAQLERDRMAAEERAKQAAAKAETDRIAAAEQAERDRLAAVETERQRVEGERLREEAATRRREEDKAHKAKVNRAARDAIVKVIDSVAGSGGDQDTTTAKAIVEAIARGEIPNVRISY